MIIHVFNSSLVSGPERLVIPALKSVGDEVFVILLEEQRLAEKSKSVRDFVRSHGLNFQVVAVRGRFDLAAVRELGQVLQSKSPDIIHAHDVKASIYTRAACSRKRRIKASLISTHHGVRGRPGVRNRLYETLYRRAFLRSFDRALAVCTSDEQLLMASGVPPVKVYCHLNGIDGTPLKADEKKLLRQKVRTLWERDFHQKFSGDSFLIGMVGRLAPEKRHDRALSVLAILRERGDNIHMLFIGSGPLEPALKDLVVKRHLESYVTFCGYRENAAEEIAGLDLLLSLSDTEGLPINLIEAGWARTPVAATAIDGVNDLIPDNNYGLRIDHDMTDEQIADQIAVFARKNHEAEACSERFQKRVMRDFSRSAWVQRLEQIYGDCREL